MPVTLGKHGDYAVRAALDVARHWGDRPRKAREIAASMDIPPDFLKRILSELVSQGLLTSAAGSNGGYLLARSPEDISLLDIVEPAERLLSADRCVLRGGPCDWSDVCAIHDTWYQAQKAFAETLDATNLAQLAEIDRDIERGSYTPIHPVHADPTNRNGIRM
jgi:Rrf2 family protein